VVALDANEDVRSGTVSSTLDLGLKEAIIDQMVHPHSHTAQALSTALCLLRYSVSAADTTGMVTGVLDGYSPATLLAPQPRTHELRLDTRPSLRAYLNKYDLFSCTGLAQITVPPPPHKLLNGNTWILCTTGMLTAERNCRKLRMGGDPVPIPVDSALNYMLGISFKTSQWRTCRFSHVDASAELVEHLE
jgi:hypothetical protein